MRVLLVTNTYPPGDVSGVGTLVSELARSLGDAGHRTQVWTRRSTSTGPGVRAIGASKLLFPLVAGWRWARTGAEERFDVVHVHESDGLLVVLWTRLGRLLGSRRGRTRIVATLQVSYREERRSVRAIYDRDRVLSRPTGSELLFAWLRAPLLSLAGRLTARLADAVVAPSRRTAAELARDYGARRVVVIPNGVRLSEAPAGRPESGAPTVLYAGRLRTRKAVTVLVHAFARVIVEVPGARLVIAGDGEQRASLTSDIERLGLGDAVEIRGSLPPEQVAGLLATASCLCMPSIYEGLPLVILEAMALGVPVVATAVSGHPDAIVDGRSGWLVPPENSAALAAALVEALRAREEARRRADAARRRFVERFEIGVVTRSYVDLLAGDPGHGSP